MTSLDHERKVKNLVEKVENSDQISDKNADLILDFKRDLSLDGLSAAWQQNCLSRMKVMAETADFDFDEGGVDDLKDLVEAIQKRDITERTVVDYKKVLKKFYKWLNDGEHPEITDWVKTTCKTKDEPLPENLLTEEDVEELISHAPNNREKALISLLWETGARIGKLLTLQ